MFVGSVVLTISFFLFFFTWPPSSSVSEIVQSATIPVTLSEVKDFTIPEPSVERLKLFPSWDNFDHAFVLFVCLVLKVEERAGICLHLRAVAATLIVIRSSILRMATFRHIIIFSATTIDCKSWWPSRNCGFQTETKLTLNTQPTRWSSVSADTVHSFSSETDLSLGIPNGCTLSSRQALITTHESSNVQQQLFDRRRSTPSQRHHLQLRHHRRRNH